MERYIPKLRPQYVVKLFFLFLVYILAGKLGLTLYALHGFAAMVWPGAGIAIAALLLYGNDLWPAVAVGAFCVNISTGASPALALTIAAGNTLEAIVGVYLLQQYVVLYRCFERLSDTLSFISLSICIATPISATIGVLGLLASHTIALKEFGLTWLTWWIGDSLGILVVTPFLLTCLKPSRPWNADKLNRFEIVAGYSFLFLSNIFIFWSPFTQLKDTPLLYLILFPLIWGGLRFGSRGMTISIFITSVIATISTVYGHGPFTQSSTTDNILFLQIFIGTISIMFLIFLSIVKERKLAMQNLTEHVFELEDAVKKISSADQAKNDFLAILAHELRNPLAPILSSLELMKMRDDTQETTRDLVTTIESNIHTMSRLLNDLLDISRISRKKIILKKESVELDKIISSSIEMVKPLINEKNHRLTVDIQSKNVCIFGDPLRIEQIFVNILRNASKYTDAGGHITVTCYIHNTVAVVAVRDTGVGIAPHMIKKIFEPFLQVTEQAPRSEGGIGIGLALTREFVRLHDGEITAKSSGLGKGSTFAVTLPIISSSSEVKQKSTPAPQTIQSSIEHVFTQVSETVGDIVNKVLEKKFSIMVVDDNHAAAHGLAELLRYRGHTVTEINDAMSVIQTIQRTHPNVVILDIGLPIMNGYEVAEHIRQDVRHDLVLVALTGYGQDEDKRKAKQAGFDYHLTKPIGLADIEKILAEI